MSGISERLDRHRDTSGGQAACWPWTDTHTRDGYGRVWYQGRLRNAHVVALIDATGDDQSATKHALHSCDNPPCTNPAHLRWGTRRENMADMLARGRQRVPRGTQHPGSRLTDADVLAIRSRPGETLTALAAEFGVSFAMIGKIRRGESWRHLITTNEGQ